MREKIKRPNIGKVLKEKYGEDYFRNLGKKGGKATGIKGFALNPELARVAGAKGGSISKRGKAKKNDN